MVDLTPITENDVVDNLSDDSANKPLSASKGKVLNETKLSRPDVSGSGTYPLYYNMDEDAFAMCEQYAGGTCLNINGTGKGGQNASIIAPTGAMGSPTIPVYVKSNGMDICSTYAGGTKVTLNGDVKGASTATFYAPTEAGDTTKVLTGGTTPAWENKEIFVHKKLVKTGLTLSGETSTQYVWTPDTVSGYSFLGCIGQWTSVYEINVKVSIDNYSGDIICQLYNPASTSKTFTLSLRLLYVKEGWHKNGDE